MKPPSFFHLIATGLGAFASCAVSAPIVWTCESTTNPGSVPFSYSIDLEAGTLDTRGFSRSGSAITVSRWGTGTDRLTTTINLETGALTVDSSERGAINRGVCLPPGVEQARRNGNDESQAAAPAQTNPAPAASAPPDERQAELKKTYASLVEQARAGKIKYLNAARLYQEKFESLYPEQAGNALMTEYLAYMAVVGEKVDKKKLTEAEAQYELAKKVSELQERAAAQQEAVARKAATEAAMQKASADMTSQKARDDEAARQARVEAAARQDAEERRLALQREIAERQFAQAEAQRKAESSAALMQMGLQLLFPPRPKVCTGYWSGPTWVQTCN